MLYNKGCLYGHPFFFFFFEERKNMSRIEIRDLIFKMLFRVEFHKEEEIPDQLALFLEEDGNEEEKSQEYIETKCKDIIEKLSEIDIIINESAQGWKTTRMGKVDLSLIRLAVYEMKFEDDIPTGVAINEAVELAKKYGTDDSPSFVNGILAKIA